MEAKNNNRVPTEQATHLVSDMEEKNATLQQALEKAKGLLKAYQKGKAGKLNVQEILELDEATIAFLDGAK